MDGDAFVVAEEGSEHDLSQVVALLNALTSAWSIYRLYPNPASQPAFGQAVDMLRSLDDSLPITLDVGAAGFTHGGSHVTSARSGVDQLAKRLYLHDVEALTVEEPPSEDDVIELFAVLALDEAEVAADGGAAARVEAGAFRIYERRTLEEELEEGGRGEGKGGNATPDRASPLAALVDSGAEPDQVLEHLVEVSSGETAEMADRYLEAFGEIHDITDATGAPNASMDEMFAPYLLDDMGPSPTGTFIDVFFRMPAEARDRVFASVVASSDEAVSRMFLDQLSGTELLRLADELDEDSRERLMAYAVDAAEADPGHASDLAPLLASTAEVRQARQTTAAYAARLLDEVELRGTEHLADEIRSELKPDGVEEYGRAVVKALFQTIERPDRLRRLARIWASRIKSAAARGDYRRAIAEVESVQDEGRYSPGQTEAMGTALGRIVNAEFVADIAVGEHNDERLKLLRALGTPATKRLIELLADEEDATTRRSLLDLLAVLCTSNPRPLISALNDERWYVVRNVAMILGKTGHTSAVRHLKKHLSHSDARVRVEVLRALAPLAQDEIVDILIKTLSDDNKRVRYAAVSMLKAADGSDVDRKLAGILEDSSVSEAALLGVVEALAGRSTPGSTEALESLAGKRFAVNKASRGVRNAAREALEARK